MPWCAHTRTSCQPRPPGARGQGAGRATDWAYQGLVAACGHSSVVEHHPSKVTTRVRFPVPAQDLPALSVRSARCVNNASGVHPGVSRPGHRGSSGATGGDSPWQNPWVGGSLTPRGEGMEWLHRRPRSTGTTARLTRPRSARAAAGTRSRPGPASSTTRRHVLRHAPLAQSVERRHGKAEVCGSKPQRGSWWPVHGRAFLEGR